MAEIVEYPLEGGGVLLVQSASVDAGQGELGLASPVEDKAKKAKETLESALAHVTPALKSVAGKLRDLSPDDLTVEFGLTLTAETGVIVAKGGTEVHFKVTLAWSRNSGSTSLVLFVTNGSSRTGR
jgi:hypothetical protein